jgi:hypothetical protein
MDTKNTRMGSNVQANLRSSYHDGNNAGEHAFKHSGHVVRGSGGHNRTKMAEAIKLLNILGLSVYILGLFANLGNIISVTLGAVGIAWGIIRCFRAYEEYLIRKIDRMERENGYNQAYPKPKKKDKIEEPKT